MVEKRNVVVNDSVQSHVTVKDKLGFVTVERKGFGTSDISIVNHRVIVQSSVQILKVNMIVDIKEVEKSGED